VRGRHITTAVTLLVLLGLLAAGAVIGIRSLLAPIPDGKSDAASSCSTKQVRKGQRISTHQVEVSVFNAGTRAGLADETMGVLTNRGFDKGSVGNAPPHTGVRVVQIWTTKKDDAAARLVALQFGRSVKVRVKHVNLGPGVDVVVGNGFRKLARAKRYVVVRHSQSVCLPTAKPSS
jgi:hypothetical protein